MFELVVIALVVGACSMSCELLVGMNFDLMP